MTDLTNSTPIPLTHLVPWSGNVRTTERDDALGELTASIAAHGLLAPLVVRQNGPATFAVVAGGRRLRALTTLAHDGRLAPDAPIPCRLLAADADPTEVSLAENVVRAPMQPTDQLAAFRALVEQGHTVPTIADRFGVSEAVVSKRLRLGRLSPTLLDAYRRFALTLDQLQAFTVSEDHAEQERVLAALPSWAQASHIRATLTREHIPATDRRVRFVTLAAYLDAGGAATRDLFSDNEYGVYLHDHALLDRLVAERLEAQAADVRAEGWRWVETHPSFDYADRAHFRHLAPLHYTHTAADAAELACLRAEYDALYTRYQAEGDDAADAAGWADEEEDEDEDPAAQQDQAETNDEASDEENTLTRLETIEHRMRALGAARSPVYAPETLALAGAVVTLDHDGTVELLRGLLRPEDAPAMKTTGGPSPTPTTGTAPPAKDRPALSDALRESLSTHRSTALAAALTIHPALALAAVTHALALQLIHHPTGDTCLQLTAHPTNNQTPTTGGTALACTYEEWRARTPKDPAALWDWCRAQDQDTLLDLLACCAARAVDAVARKHDGYDGSRRLAHADALAAALALDMTAWFTATADTYFLHVTRAQILAALAEATGKPAERAWDKLKKHELAALAERTVAGTGWLPATLRAPHAAADAPPAPAQVP